MKTKELIEILTALVENKPEAAEYRVTMDGQHFNVSAVRVEESFYREEDFVVDIY